MAKRKKRSRGDEFVTRAEVERMIAKALREHDRIAEEILDAIFPREKIAALAEKVKTGARETERVVRLIRRQLDDDDP